MSSPRPIRIAGGGLAGLTLGIALRRHDVPVTVLEAGSYPRQRVCGEFVCGDGIEVLRDLGLHGRLTAAGAVEARTVAFCAGDRSYRPKAIPRPALCLSRYTMDKILADEFRRLGGVLKEGERVNRSDYGAGLVRATGRRLPGRPDEVKWIGLKAHGRHVRLAADLEMHFVPAGYIGLCRLAGGAVNICGLFALRGPVPQLAGQWREFLRGPPGSILRQRLEGMEFIEGSFCAVAGFSLLSSRAETVRECCVGDAMSMIPPVTGNGMSMAFESAAWAAEPLADYSRGERNWEDARLAIARRCDAGFRRRLWWANWLQRGLMRRSGRRIFLALGDRCDWVWQAWFNKTR